MSNDELIALRETLTAREAEIDAFRLYDVHGMNVVDHVNFDLRRAKAMRAFVDAKIAYDKALNMVAAL